MSKFIRTIGTEGPSHDPYSYEEISFYNQNGESMTIHMGLGVYLKEDKDLSEDDAIKAFVEFVGMDLKHIERTIQKIEYPDKCRTCGTREFYWSDGYPGEEFRFCKNGHYAGYAFNESAII